MLEFYFLNKWQEYELRLFLRIVFNRGIKHDFPFINIRNIPREVLKTEGEARGSTFPRDLANVKE